MEPVRHDDDPPPLLLYLTKQLEMAVRSELERALDTSDVSVAQYTALTVLERSSGLTSAALARRSFVTAQAMSEVVRTLEANGLLTREPDPSHAKRLLISLTPAGRGLLDDLRRPIAQLERRMTEGLDEVERDGLRRSMAACLANLRDA